MAQKIFISYRRADSADVCGRIYDRLVARFGRDQVVKDVDTIPLGVDFAHHIGTLIGECAVQLVVLGPAWLGPAGPLGRRRIDDPNDFVRLEVEAALGRGLPVLPLLVQGASLPPARRLPPSLRALVGPGAPAGLPVRPDPLFDEDIQQVIARVGQALARPRPPVAPRPPAIAQPAITAADQAEAPPAVPASAVADANVPPMLPRRGLALAPARLSALVASVVLLLSLVAASELTGIPFGRHRTQSGPSPTATTNVAATQTVGVLQTVAAGPSATAAAVPIVGYSAKRPGPCDANGQLWAEDVNGSAGRVMCTADSMELVDYASVHFELPATATFPPNFRVSVDVSAATGQASPAIFRASEPNSVGGTISVGGDGGWGVTYRTTAAQYAFGQVPVSNSYTLTLTVQHGTISFGVNGTQVAAIPLSQDTMLTTDVGLLIGNNATIGSAQFKNFVFMPLT